VRIGTHKAQPAGLDAGGDLIYRSAQELTKRKKSWKPPEPRIKTGCLAKYAAMATSPDTGAVLKW
jgi:dihydroxyacid dehydratase/phosphogluconate dehydratase